MAEDEDDVNKVWEPFLLVLFTTKKLITDGKQNYKYQQIQFLIYFKIV